MATRRKKKVKESSGFKVKEEVQPEVKTDLDVKSERENLFKSWKRLVVICETLLTQAELNPLDVKASLLAQIVRVLSQSGKILDDYEKHLRKIDDEPKVNPETGEPEITSDEQAMIDLVKGNSQTNQPEYKDPDLNYGLNFRRG